MDDSDSEIELDISDEELTVGNNLQVINKNPRLSESQNELINKNTRISAERAKDRCSQINGDCFSNFVLLSVYDHTFSLKEYATQASLEDSIEDDFEEESPQSSKPEK